MTTRIILMPPSRKTILQSANNIMDGKENKHADVTSLQNSDEHFGESDPEDWRHPYKKKSSIPNYVTNADGGNLKRRHARSSKTSLHQPTLSVIARRNERERNRVRQVNDSFSALRNRIPVNLYETETDEKGKQTRKKLSKVETLRLAVQYIHKLEGLLNIKPETYDSEDFDDDDLMDSSEKLDNDSQSETGAMDLSKDEKYSDGECSEHFDDKQSMSSEFSKELQYPFDGSDFSIGVKSEAGDLSSDAGNSSPLPPISSSFALNLGYSELYANYDTVQLDVKC